MEIPLLSAEAASSSAILDERKITGVTIYSIASRGCFHDNSFRSRREENTSENSLRTVGKKRSMKVTGRAIPLGAWIFLKTATTSAWCVDNDGASMEITLANFEDSPTDINCTAANTDDI